MKGTSPFSLSSLDFKIAMHAQYDDIPGKKPKSLGFPVGVEKGNKYLVCKHARVNIWSLSTHDNVSSTLESLVFSPFLPSYQTCNMISLQTANSQRNTYEDKKGPGPITKLFEPARLIAFFGRYNYQFNITIVKELKNQQTSPQLQRVISVCGCVIWLFTESSDWG